MTPRPAYVPPTGLRTRLEDFMEHVAKKHGVKIDSYWDLHNFSINRMNDFWMTFWNYAEIKASKQPTKIYESATIDQFPKFFQDARLNFAENILCGEDDDLMIINIDETTLHSPSKFTWGDMRKFVATYADALKRQGLKNGDFMVSIGSNCARSLAILLAAASIGAVIANFATDIGEKALNDRLDQLRPKLIIAETSYSYNGKINNIEQKVTRCFQEVSRKTQCQLVIIGPDSNVSSQHVTIDSFIQSSKSAELVFEQELGIDIEAFDPEGKPCAEGERGELVCRKPFPNMPVMFLNDPGNKRYHASYVEGFSNVWTHGDFIRVNPETKGIYVLGRSDGVLIPSGVRFGSAEMYTVLDSPALKPFISDALVVGQQRSTQKYSDHTEQVLLFVKPTSSTNLDSNLIDKIRQQIINDLSRRHVPHYFFEVDEIPYNVNGKKLETLVKKIVNGGLEVRAKLKMTDDEARTMRKFEEYYDVEEVGRRQGNGKAKL